MVGAIRLPACKVLEDRAFLACAEAARVLHTCYANSFCATHERPRSIPPARSTASPATAPPPRPWLRPVRPAPWRCPPTHDSSAAPSQVSTCSLSCIRYRPPLTSWRTEPPSRGWCRGKIYPKPGGLWAQAHQHTMLLPSLFQSFGIFPFDKFGELEAKPTRITHFNTYAIKQEQGLGRKQSNKRQRTL